MRKIFITTFICLITIFVNGQTSEAKGEKIKTMIQLSGSDKLGVQLSKQMIALFRKNFSEVNQEFWDDFEKNIKADDLINLVIPIYDKYFTEEEIDQLIAFYKSPIGKKLTGVMPQVSKESMEAGQMWGKKIGEKVMEQLKAKGYLKGNQ